MEQQEKEKIKFSKEQYIEDVSIGLLKPTEETLCKAEDNIEKINSGAEAGFFKKTSKDNTLKETKEIVIQAIEKVRDIRAELNYQEKEEAVMSFGPGQGKESTTE